MATNYVWHVLWRYSKGGKPLDQFPTQAADIIAGFLVGGDGTISPDPNSVATAISNNFPVPPGATIVIVGISSAQSPAVFS